MKQKGTLLVVSGFSGAGKGTVIKRLLEKYDGAYALSVSATTRSPRPGEEDGREYFFKTKEQFEKMIANGDLIEYAKYVDNYYGTPRSYVEEKLARGVDVILEIEIQGAFQVKEVFPEAVLVFVAPPSAAELRRRLTGRGTETEEVIENRLRTAVKESEAVSRYEYVIINDDLEDCVDHLHRIAGAGKDRVSGRIELIRSIAKDLKKENAKD